MAEQSNVNSQTSAAGVTPPPSHQIPREQMEALYRSAAFGDIVSILMRAPKHKNLSLNALRMFVVPAVLNNQYLIARVRQPEKNGTAAAGVALWASVSDEVDRRLKENAAQPVRLAADEWNSGSNLWLVDLVAPALLTGSILNDLEKRVARGRPMAAQISSNSDTMSVTTLADIIAGQNKSPA